MRRRWRDLVAASVAALTLAAASSAQADATPFVAPDGSRFLLYPDPTATAVHWAVASPIDLAQDPHLMREKLLPGGARPRTL